MRILITLVLLFVSLGTVWADDSTPFSVSVLSLPERVPLGVGRAPAQHPGVGHRLEFEATVEVRHVGESPVPIVPSGFWGYRSDDFSIYARTVNESGVLLAGCRPRYVADGIVMGAQQLEPGWTLRVDVPVCVPGPGRYMVEFVVQESRDTLVTPDGKVVDLWVGSSSSGRFRVEVVEPEGIDREAYEAFKGDPLGDSRRFRELIHRFPASTYAAYAIWQRWGRLRIPEWKSEEDRAATLGWLESDPGGDYLTWKMPCTKDGQRDASVETRFEEREAMLCRDSWMQEVLRTHPEIWFADEIRFALAVDHYRLGERDSAVLQLGTLAEHGKPYVGAMAKDLLASLEERRTLRAGAK